MGISKPIRFSAHARLRLAARGATEEDAADAIRTAEWRAAEGGRLECRKDFAFDALWNGKRYATRQVRPIFADLPDEIVVVTVYVFWF